MASGSCTLHSVPDLLSPSNESPAAQGFRLAGDLVAAVAGVPSRARRPAKKPLVSARTGTLTQGATNLLDEISGSPVYLKRRTQGSSSNLRGVFYHGTNANHDSMDMGSSPGDPSPSRVRAVDFRQRLDMLVATEDSATAVARKLYSRFEGDTTRLPGLLQLLEDRWGFPERVFPLLWTHLDRATGYADDLPHVEEDEWVEAFTRWLQVVRTRLERTKMSRQCFVQTQSGADRAKVYLQGAKLGEGSYGEVYMAFHKDLGVDRVVKSVPKAQLGMAEEQVEDEVNTLKSLDHPHIVRIFEAFETEDRLHIVMDYAEGGDLSSAIRIAQEEKSALPEAWTRDVAGQISSALEHIHSKGMVHCDLKPGNTMLLRPFSLSEARSGDCRPHALLADFGLAEIFDERPLGGAPTQVKGTPSYLAPEGFEGRVNHKSDMWALGIMIFEMLQGYRPFKGTSNVFMLFCAIANTEPSLEGMPQLAQEIVKALLAKDPKVRPTASECRQHEWFMQQQPLVRSVSALLQPSGMKTLGHESYFHRAVTFCIASALGMKEMQDLFEVFQAWDTDYSGYLSIEQLRFGLDTFGIQQDPAALMAILDLDGDSYVSITEFLAGAVQLKEGASERLIHYAFGLFDLDGDGYISMDELRLLLSGDGPSADVLPDGQTAEEVMEDVSGGKGQISYADFREYLVRERGAGPPALKASYSLREISNMQEGVSAMVHELDPSAHFGTKEVTFNEKDSTPKEFPSFHTWLADLFEETQQSAGLNSLLVFIDRKLEAAYVAHYVRSTCLQLFLLAVCLLGYALWSLLTESWTWDPAIGTWEHAPQITHNLAWLFLMVSGVGVMCICFHTLRRSPSPGHPGKGSSITDTEAMRLEVLLCVWACTVMWVGCFFANRFRVSVLFGANAEEMFTSINSDYDLIVTMIGMLMFFSTRTHMRFICIVPIAASCVLAYCITSTFLGVADSRNREEKNWAWPAILLIIMTLLCLSGHRAVEYQRRISFLSLFASYSVLREVHEENEEAPELVVTGQAGPGSFETRSARIKHAMDLVRRLGESGELVSRPLRAALSSLAEVLQSTREELVQVDRLMIIDVEAKLRQRGIEDSSQDLLLTLFDTLPSMEQVLTRTRELKSVMSAEGAPTDVGGWDASSSDSEAARPWGWETLSGTATASPDTVRQLAVAGGTLLLPAVAAAAAQSGGMEAAESARSRARSLLDALLRHYASGPRSAEARAALTVQATHWIAHRVGLWQSLTPWERVALLVAALGLRCGAGAEGGVRGGSLIAWDPLLGQAASASRTLAVLESSGLGEAGAGEQAPALRTLLRRFMARARPRCVLEDLRRMRAHFERDDQVPTAPTERAVLASLVLAAADLAFLALPPSLHRPWALLCQAEAAEAQLPDLAWIEDTSTVDAASWLRGLTEVLALPVFETLGLLDKAEAHLAVPVRHLRENAKYWKMARLSVVTPSDRPDDLRDAASSTAFPSPTGDPSALLTWQAGLDTLRDMQQGTRWQDTSISSIGEDDNQQEPRTIVATLPPGHEAAPLFVATPRDLSQSLEVRSVNLACETSMSQVGTVNFANDRSMNEADALAAVLSPTSVSGSLAFATVPVGAASPAATLKGGTLKAATVLVGNSPSATLAGAGTTLKVGTLVPGTPSGTLAGATLKSATLASEALEEARRGEGGQSPLAPDATLRSTHSVSIIVAPRAKLPGSVSSLVFEEPLVRVSPVSDSESVEDEWH